MSLLIEIENPTVKPMAKFMKAMTLLSKATKVEFTLGNQATEEPSPYKSVRQHAENTSKVVEDRLYLLWSEMIKTWLGLTLEKAVGDQLPFKLNGKILLNPKSGKPLTRAQWKVIQKDLTKMFTWMYGDTQENLVRRAVALGKIVQQLDPDKRIVAPVKSLALDSMAQTVDQSDVFQNTLSWGEIHTGELITDVTARSRKRIVETIQQAYQDGKTPKQLQNDLFDQFSVLNRDWRRIAETETASNFNDGYLLTELENKGDAEYMYMIGISGGGACAFCASHVNDHVVVLLESSPGGDSITIDGKDYTAIWPGKSNAGRKHADWWVASGVQHPHCGCTWTRYYPEIEKYTRKLRSATAT